MRTAHYRMVGGLLTATIIWGLVVLVGLARRSSAADSATVIQRVREVAQLETLQVNVYKKVSLKPEPTPKETLAGSLAQWAKFTVNPPEGKAIVFAVAHLGLDLRELTPEALLLSGENPKLELPRMKVVVELLPGETEIIGSNLDSKQTAELLEQARLELEREVSADEQLQARALDSARRAIRGVLWELGYKNVELRLPASL